MQTVDEYLKSKIVDVKPLLSLVLNKNTSWLYSYHNYQLSKIEKIKLDNFIKKRQDGVPFAYLEGKKGFYNLNFKLTKDTLIPRPETELLIDIVLDLLDKDKNYDIVDLGTGSGIIAITLKDICPNWNITATDLSPKALNIAKQNATTKINFKKGNWFDALPDKTFDLIISNPPYIKQDDVHLKNLSFEPKSALISGKDGLDDIKIIIKNAPKHLNKNGYLLLEHGFNQQQQIKKILKNNFFNIKEFKDYNQQDRAILAQVK